MEGVDPRRQQYEQTYQPARYGANISGSNVPERYGQPQTQARQIPTTGPGTGVGAHSQALRVYPYAQGQQQYAPQMQDTSMEYQTEFTQDAQRQQQQFQTYSSGMMYNLPAQVQPAQQPSSYDPVQQYQPRQSAAIEVLSNQFGVPQYYNTGEPTSAPTQIAQTYASAQYQQQSSFQQSLTSNRPSESTPYVPAGVGDYSQLAMSNVLEQQAEPSQDPSASEEPYKTYLESLKQTYQYAYDGRMIEAGQRLLDLSDWLIGHATALGLTRDEPELQSQRLKLWNDFNNCWLAVLQRQKDLTQQMIDTQQPPPENHTLLQEGFLERMARELVRMCDVMERHGLVDYEMGVWEEEIMNVLLDCLHLLEGDPDEPSGQSSRPIGSHPRQSQ